MYIEYIPHSKWNRSTSKSNLSMATVNLKSHGSIISLTSRDLAMISVSVQQEISVHNSPT